MGDCIIKSIRMFIQCSTNFSMGFEKLRKTVDAGGGIGAVFTNLSKAFDCTDHNLLIAKLDAYGFQKISIDFNYSYFLPH